MRAALWLTMSLFQSEVFIVSWMVSLVIEMDDVGQKLKDVFAPQMALENTVYKYFITISQPKLKLLLCQTSQKYAGLR